MSALQIILILLLIASFGATAYWAILLVRVANSVRMSISMKEGIDCPEPSGGWPRVGIVVPAHNEEEMIERCARSIAAQKYPAFEAVFVLDRCTDRTESIIRDIAGGDDRIRIEHIEECPEDWAGKCNAARVGANTILDGGAEFLVFTDADALFDPDLIRSSVAIALREEASLLSVLSTLTTSRWDELFVQPVATLSLMRMHPTDRVNRRDSPHAFANGQFMLFTRTSYEALGGHERVREDLLEDIALARAVVAGGDRAIVVNADSMLEVSMYDSLTSLLAGWKRIYIEVARRRAVRLFNWGSRLFCAGVVVPCIQVATIVIGAILASSGDTTALVLALVAVGSGLIMQILSLAWFYRIAGVSVLGVLGFPLGCLIVARAMFEGGRDISQGRPIRWGGREYVLKAD
jgi:glycosyltransferase involved in cell wall biosynthesis